jgi:hypothetical protein
VKQHRRFQRFIDPILHLALSFIGIAILMSLVNSPSTVQSSVPWAKPILGLIFSLICASGIVAGLFPGRCSAILFGRKSGKLPPSHSTFKHATSDFLGHHPTCGSFRAHVFKTKNKVYCAGCIGLISGGLLSIIGVVLYFFLQVIQCPNCFPIFLSGVAGVSAGLLQYHLFNLGRASVHVVVNTVFVVGVFLILLAVDAMTHNMILECYVIVLSFFWLYVRIHLSEYDHQRICSRCQRSPCTFI